MAQGLERCASGLRSEARGGRRAEAGGEAGRGAASLSGGGGAAAGRALLPFAVEPTAIGAQSLIPGVAPISVGDRLAQRAAAPFEPKKPQRACDLGLFDLNARAQLDLFAGPGARS